MATLSNLERALSPTELSGFFAELAATPGLTLARIAELAAERGISISLSGAKRVKDGPFGDYLDALRRKREMAEDVAAVAKSGLSLADASASILSQKVFDRLMSAGELTDGETNELSLALSRLRLGDQRRDFLEARLREMEAREAEREATKKALTAEISGAKKRGGLTREALEKIEQAAGLL